MSISFWIKIVGESILMIIINCVTFTCRISEDHQWVSDIFAVHRLTQFLGISVGDLICPMYHELCDDPVPSMPGQCPHDCHQNGDCNNGKCTCFLGYSGDHCSERKSLFYWTLDVRGTVNRPWNICIEDMFLFKFLDNCRGGNVKSQGYL